MRKEILCKPASLVRLACAFLFMMTICGAAAGQTIAERKSPKPAQAAQQAPASTAAPVNDMGAISKPEDKVFKGMKYRLIGPFRGGRSLTAAGVPGDPTTYYFGAEGGGVWKSTDGALTWCCPPAGRRTSR